MKAFNVLFTGVGGTGVLTAARIIASAALLEGNNVRMGEIHGMAQRGGAVTCSVRIGKSARGPIIPMSMADMLLGVEPVEALRHANKMSPKGTIIVGEYRIIPTAVLLGHAQYPSNQEIFQNLKRFASVITIDVVRLAKEAGNILTSNTVLMGAASNLGKLPIKPESIIAAMKSILPSTYHEMNLNAFKKGQQAVTEA
jgi:indolepyruvate ferredoxin oxidoreductase beta subunit